MHHRRVSDECTRATRQRLTARDVSAATAVPRLVLLLLLLFRSTRWL